MQHTCRAYLTARQLRGMIWKPPAVVDTSVNEARAWGARAARRVAIMPPMLCPTTCTSLVHPRCSYTGSSCLNFRLEHLGREFKEKKEWGARCRKPCGNHAALAATHHMHLLGPPQALLPRQYLPPQLIPKLQASLKHL